MVKHNDSKCDIFAERFQQRSECYPNPSVCNSFAASASTTFKLNVVDEVTSHSKLRVVDEVTSPSRLTTQRDSLPACKVWWAFLNKVRNAFAKVRALQAQPHLFIGRVDRLAQAPEHSLVDLFLNHS
jgi:hypothetical protein